jgi:hypothetical protein
MGAGGGQIIAGWGRTLGLPSRPFLTLSQLEQHLITLLMWRGRWAAWISLSRDERPESMLVFFWPCLVVVLVLGHPYCLDRMKVCLLHLICAAVYRHRFRTFILAQFLLWCLTGMSPMAWLFLFSALKGYLFLVLWLERAGFLFFFPFWDRVLLCIPSWSRTYYPPAFPSWVLGL